MAALAQTSPVPTGPQFDNRRVAAALIDLLIPLAGVAAARLAGLSLTRGVLLVGVGWTLYYFFALESGDGQTLGKRVMKLRVVSADGTPATMEQIAKRTAVRIIDGHIVGLIVMLATGDRRLRLGDIVAGTVVTDAQSAPGPATHAPAPSRPAAKPSLLEPQAPEATAAKPQFLKGLPSLPSLPSLGSRKPRAARTPKQAVATPGAKKPSLLKRQLSLPSFARKPRRGAATDSPAPSRVAGPGPGAVDTPSVPAPAPAISEPPQPAKSDRLSEALRAAEPREVQPVEAFDRLDVVQSAPTAEVAGRRPSPDLGEPERVVAFDGPEPAVEFERAEPTVEFDDPEPTVEFERAEPTVEFDDPEAWDEADEPDPLADLGGREPVVDVDEPFPETAPAADSDDEAESPSENEMKLTIKPIETVSAIDLVMQDAEDRRPPRS